MQETWVQFLGQKDPPKKGNLTDRGAWQATVHGFRRVRHNLATQLPHLICMCPENTSCIECGLTRSEGYQVKGAMPRRPTHTQGRRLLPLLLLTHPPWKESQLLFPHPLPRNHLHCFSQDDKQAEVSLWKFRKLSLQIQRSPILSPIERWFSPFHLQKGTNKRWSTTLLRFSKVAQLNLSQASQGNTQQWGPSTVHLTGPPIPIQNVSC